MVIVRLLNCLIFVKKYMKKNIKEDTKPLHDNTIKTAAQAGFNNEFKASILIADDEPDILEILEYYLARNNFFVLKAKNGEEAYQLISNKMPDLVLLDIMMPEVNGLDVLKKIKQNPLMKDIVVVMLTAISNEKIEIEAIESGADDFISKPIKPNVLLSRIEGLLRKNKKQNTGIANTELSYKDITIDKEMYVAKKGNVTLDLPRKEFELLHLLLSSPGKVFRREQILERVWGKEVLVGDRTIDVHIRRLREKIGEKLIKTATGIGYKIE